MDSLNKIVNIETGVPSLLDDMIRTYVEKGAKVENVDARLINRLQSTLREDIKNQVFEEYSQELAIMNSKVASDQEKEIRKLEDKEHTKRLKETVIESVFFAFAVGLSVNQITEILLGLKGSHVHYLTWVFTSFLVASSIGLAMWIFFRKRRYR